VHALIGGRAGAAEQMTFTLSRPIKIKRTAGGYRIEDKTERTLLEIDLLPEESRHRPGLAIRRPASTMVEAETAAVH